MKEIQELISRKKFLKILKKAHINTSRLIQLDMTRNNSPKQERSENI